MKVFQSQPMKLVAISNRLGINIKPPPVSDARSAVLLPADFFNRALDRCFCCAALLSPRLEGLPLASECEESSELELESVSHRSSCAPESVFAFSFRSARESFLCSM